VIAATTLAACNSKNAYIPPPPAKVQVTQPLQRPITEYLELTGNTQAFASVDLVARVQGFLTSINYVDGATVKKGAQLFGIERDIYQAQVNQQEATLASDQATEEYNKAEYGRQATPPRQDSPGHGAQGVKSAGPVSGRHPECAGGSLAREDQPRLTQVLALFDGVVTNHA
jgi:multidrug efflux pump subunit AcrA (membrane-fusion protein)